MKTVVNVNDPKYKLIVMA